MPCHGRVGGTRKDIQPPFIYGGVGLGKTHLMQAIGHQVSALNSSARVVYTLRAVYERADQRHTLREHRLLRERYRNVDVLMIDDIQFLAGKERTKGFFHLQHPMRR